MNKDQAPKRILSGVQPSGKLHLGNYFGAVRQHIALQNEAECFYFIADYHALTTIQRAEDPRPEYPGRRARLPRPRPRSRQGGVLPPVGRAGGVRADVDPQHRHQHGAPGARGLLQGKDRQGDRGERRPVHLSRVDGVGHPHLSFPSGAGRQGPGPAPGNDAGHGRQVQPHLPRGFPHPRLPARQGIESPRHRRPENEQVVRQHHRDLRGRQRR